MSSKIRFYEEGSDIFFGDFNAGDCFRIEESNTYQQLKRYGIASVEFILSRPSQNALLFVEAKKSLAKIDNNLDFCINIDNLCKKFYDSFILSCSIWFKKQKCLDDLPTNFPRFFRKDTRYILVLIVKNFYPADKLYIEEAIKKRLFKERKFWGFEVYVISEKMAIARELALDNLHDLRN